MALPKLKKPRTSLKLKFRRQRAFKLRFRRQLRLQKMQVEELGQQAEQRLEDDFFKRLERLGVVKRFVSTWLLLVILLIGVVVAQIRGLSGYYQVLAAAPGGTFTEGVLGNFTNANPIYATGLTDTSVSRLIFAGLVNYDRNNRLTGDLAESWTVDDPGTTYTVRLKPGLVWQDGQKLTARDVVFTYQVIQNPDARSPLFNSWQGITVTAVNDRIVVFKLPNPLASFPYSLTTGIVPEHILKSVSMTNMRSVSFNTTQPVGAGPFQWQALELSGGSADKREEKIAMKAFDRYNGGKPKLNGFVIRTFNDADQMVKSFQHQELTALAGLAQMPDALKNDSAVRVYNLPLSAAVMTFFRTQEGVLADPTIRQALVRAADTKAIVAGLPYPTKPVQQALLRGQIAYDPKYNQAGHSDAGAAAMLDQAGWVMGKDGIRSKDGTPLSFSLYFLDSSEYSSVANQLARQWRAAGVDVKLVAQNEADFRTVLSQAPSPGRHTYDALLYGISIGADPDVYVYWHSSQIDLRSAARLNFSEYKSGAADTSLEAGRTRLDPALRAVKYQPFLQAWQSDAPALAIYQPRFLYITRGAVYGLNETPINTDAGRFSDVDNWMIREEWVTPTE
ncbi:MAG TPA: peptide ABC transporter substrate-binding protein [Candidatus Pristimantibacillus sp.]|nr:peptide ABC transporter substrate-binding protein [Candidatus Pristimantibacillus sp.]